MASLKELEAALVNAHAAGDSAGAKVLAQAVADKRKAYGVDTEYSATDGMSGGEKFLAGAGKAFVDMGRGLGQWAGLVSRDDVAESRRLDAPLMQTGAGMAGNIAGNVAMAAPTVLIPGAATVRGAAAIGAGFGAAQPSTSTLETAKNIGTDAALGAGGVLAGRAIGAAWQGGKALLEPLTQGGREKIAARTMQRFATNPQQAATAAAGARPLVPGSAPTLAEATADPGLSQLQRTLRNNPDYARLFDERAATQNAARLEALRGIAGDDGQREFFEAARQATAKELYGKAFADGIDPTLVTKEVKGQIKGLLQRPAIQQAMSQARELAKNEGLELKSTTSLQGLHYTKMALDDQISAATRAGDKNKARILLETKSKLDDVMDKVSPSYGEARRQFAEASKPIARMDVGQSLLDTYQPALGDFGASARVNANAYANALRKGDQTAKRATGFSGAKLEKILSPDDLRTVNAVGEDLARRANAQELGRAVGSPTAQNLVSQNILRQTMGPLGLPQSWSESVMLNSLLRPVQFAGNLAEPRIQNVLAEAMLDPQMAAGLLNRAQTPSMLEREAWRLLPWMSTGLLGANPTQ